MTYFEILVSIEGAGGIILPALFIEPGKSGLINMISANTNDGTSRAGAFCLDSFIAGSVALAIVLISYYARGGYQLDDAFIFYRYAENLAAGRGLVYNAGEYVYGATSITYAVLLGMLRTVIPEKLHHGILRWV